MPFYMVPQHTTPYHSLAQMGNSAFLVAFITPSAFTEKKLTKAFAWVADFTEDLGGQNNFCSIEVSY